MRLSDLKKGQEAIITKILGHGAFRKRVMEMGFVRGREVRVAPLISIRCITVCISAWPLYWRCWASPTR